MVYTTKSAVQPVLQPVVPNPTGKCLFTRWNRLYNRCIVWTPARWVSNLVPISCRFRVISLVSRYGWSRGTKHNDR